MNTSSISKNKDVKVIIMIAAIILMGLLLRTLKLGSVPFQTTDDISTAWATTWYFPRGMESFQLGDGSIEPNPIGMITLSHGPLQAVIAYVWVNMLAFLGIHLSELWWHLPFALLGGMSVFITYLLGVRLQSPRAGLLSAMLVSVLPLHAAFSRSSGESHFILASLLQVAAILMWWNYLVSQKKSIVFIVGIILACDILTDFAFPGLVLTLFFTSLVYHQSTNGRVDPFLAMSDMFEWRLLLPALASLSVHGYAIAQALRTEQPAGMFGRMFLESQSSSTKVGGFFLNATLENILYVTNMITVITLIMAIIAFIALQKYRTPGARIALFWSSIYLLPFLFLFERSRLAGHFIPVSVAFCLFIGFVFDKLYSIKNGLIIGAIFSVTYVSLVLSTISTLYGITLPAIVNHPQDHGSVGVDRGTKTAALWVRQNMAPGSILFTDPYAQEGLPVSLYYYHRPVISLELVPGTTLDSSFKLLSDRIDLIDVIIIGHEHLNLLPNEIVNYFVIRTVIKVDQKASLYILTRSENAKAGDFTPTVMEAEIFNPRYDELYGSLADIIALPLQQIQDLKIEMDQ